MRKKSIVRIQKYSFFCIILGIFLILIGVFVPSGDPMIYARKLLHQTGLPIGTIAFTLGIYVFIAMGFLPSDGTSYIIKFAWLKFLFLEAIVVAESIFFLVIGIASKNINPIIYQEFDYAYDLGVAVVLVTYSVVTLILIFYYLFKTETMREKADIEEVLKKSDDPVLFHELSEKYGGKPSEVRNIVIELITDNRVDGMIDDQHNRFVPLNSKTLMQRYSIDLQKGVEIFISYAISDSKKLHIKEIAEKLEKMKGITKVHYWEGWEGVSEGDIISFMSTHVNSSQVFVPICTYGSYKSENCEKERKMAVFQNKYIIPIFEDFSYVSPEIQYYRGFNISNKDINEIVGAIYTLLNPKNN